MTRKERRHALAEKRRVNQAKEAERELHAHFAGRRGSPRFETFLPCRVAGGNGVYLAQVLDISRSGALIRILDTRFPDAHAGERLMHYAERVTSHFGDGLEIAFRGGTQPVEASVVRVTTRAAEAEDPACHLVGVQFVEPLTDDECRALGFRPGDGRGARTSA